MKHPLTVLVGVVLSLSAGAAFFACGSDARSGFDDAVPPPGATDGAAPPLLGGDRNVRSLAVEPPTATLTIVNDVVVTQQYKLVATYDDGSTAELPAGVSWSSTNLPIGSVSRSGLYTPTGMVGGKVKVTAQYKTQKVTADLTVKLQIEDNPGKLPPPVLGALLGATTPDPAVQWAYPYDSTVFPRGLAAPPLMWNGGGAADLYHVRVQSTAFELNAFTTVPPPSRYAFAPATWQKFVDSTSGVANVTVARLAGGTTAGAATVIAKHTWTIAPASMRGTVYYWANNQGRVMRIKPGATAPDDFSNGTFGTLPASSCTMTCHTVSADGSTLVSGGDTLGGTYNLLTNKPVYDTGGNAGTNQKRLWGMPAVSPNGKYVIQNASNLPGPPGGQDGMWNSADGTKVPASGLDGVRLGMPNFAPDGTKIAYVALSGGALSVYDFNLAAGKAGASTMLLPQAPGAEIAWPSVAPDAKWIVYQRGPADTRAGAADLFLASAVTPGQEIRLAKLNGDTYPFAAGARDKSWNYEPTFAPVPSGGFFWVVFTSRRTFGNQLTGGKDQVKLLWVAAIDLAPVPGKDPSHPAFLLPGQDLSSLNMRGFWALDPCKGDGQGCSSGTECCGGFCDGKGPDGGLVCSAGSGCSNDGDHCETTADCCNAPTGATCINHICAEPPPK